jgi:hypothetical protein
VIANLATGQDDVAGPSPATGRAGHWFGMKPPGGRVGKVCQAIVEQGVLCQRWCLGKQRRREPQQRRFGPLGEDLDLVRQVAHPAGEALALGQPIDERGPLALYRVGYT